MTAYSNNLLGALSLAVTDRVAAALEAKLGVGANAGPALLSIGTRQGESIDELSRVLGLTHSATVRIVDYGREEAGGGSPKAKVEIPEIVMDDQHQGKQSVALNTEAMDGGR